MDTTKYVSWGRAFAHCASTGSYWLSMAIVFAAVIGGTFLYFKAAKTAEVNPYVKAGLIFVAVVAIAMSILLRPGELAQNTTVEQADRGAWIGY